MKLLLDENLPVKLKHRFIENGLDSFTVKDMKWLGKENGELLSLMLQNNFTHFITIDNHLSFQNNFIDYPIGVIVLVAYDNSYETIMEFFDKILTCSKTNLTGTQVVLHPGYKV